MTGLVALNSNQRSENQVINPDSCCHKNDSQSSYQPIYPLSKKKIQNQTGSAFGGGGMAPQSLYLPK